MDLLAGWLIFGICILINCAMYWGIDMAFEKNFWREDETRKK